ncbi:MAG TPA: hypothetical protein VIR58_00740 [Acidimicrobiales bacterium]
MIVLVQERHEVVLGPDDPGLCNLGLVDDLLRLQLAAKRFGWTIRLTDVRADVRELFELVGLTGQLER